MTVYHIISYIYISLLSNSNDTYGSSKCRGRKRGVEKTGAPPGKTTTQTGIPQLHRCFYVVHRWKRISSSSSVEKVSTSSLLNFTSVISCMNFTFHSSFSSISWYFIFLMSSLHNSSTLCLSVSNRMLRRLEPVIDFESCLIKDKSCFGTCFFDFSIWFRKPRNLSSRTNFICLA